MQMGFRFAAFFAFALIAGCVGGKPVARDAAVVTVSAYGPDLFGKHEHGVGGRLEVREGVASQLSYPPMDARRLTLHVVDCEQIAQTIKPQAVGQSLGVQYQRPPETGEHRAKVFRLHKAVVGGLPFEFGDGASGKW